MKQLFAKHQQTVMNMCGRFANKKPIEDLVAAYQAIRTEGHFAGSYNIAPTESAPMVVEASGERIIQTAKFGTMMQRGGRKFPLINIQSEKAKGRKDLASRRCIIPATGFYEWVKVSEKDRQPYFFSPTEAMFAFAGIWAGSATERSFSILTTEANDVVSPIHGRMPVILGHNAQGDWLADSTPMEALNDLMRPYPSGLMQVWQVSKLVNKVANKGADCINSL